MACKARLALFFSLLVLLGLLSGCGGGGGSSISDKVWYNVSLSIKMDSINPRSCRANVDAFANACDDGTFLIEHFTPAIFTLTRMDSKVDPGPLYLEKYTITYLPLNPGSPIIPALTVYHTQQLNEGINTLTVAVMDVQRKEAFANLFLTGQHSMTALPSGYTLAYVFYGRNSYGQQWKHEAHATIFAGQYNECALCSEGGGI